jgi:predicted aconitase
MSDLRLTAEEQAMLAGDMGPAQRKAMEIVVALGRIYGAPDLVAVKSVQVAGVSYKNLGAAGLEFLNAWADEGARAVTPATLNPAGMDLARWRELGIPEDFARAQLAVVDAFARMGITLTLTCTPYLVGNRPAAGDHLAWGESSAVSFANSVLGARSNREGGPSALAAAFTGRTARYGLHLDERRRPTHLVDVRCPLRSEADLGALGALAGRQVGAGVPFFRGLDLSWTERPEDRLKSLGAAMAASGAVALYHIAGMTPEAAWAEAALRAGPPATPLLVDDLRPGYALLNGPLEAIDFVSLGCPHASLDELREIVGWLAGRRVTALLWITVAAPIRAEAERLGLAEQIEAAGGRLVADTCLVVAPVQALGVRSLATNSAKAALYALSHSGLQTRFGTTEQCLQAAVSGVWPGGTP